MTNKPMLSVERELLERLMAHEFAEDCQECGIGQSEAWKELRALLDKDADLEAIQCGGSCLPCSPKEFEWVTIDSCQPHGTIQGVGHAFPHKYKPLFANSDAGEVERPKVEHAVNSKVYCGETENHRFGDSYTCGENPYGDKNGKIHQCAQCSALLAEVARLNGVKP